MWDSFWGNRSWHGLSRSVPIMCNFLVFPKGDHQLPLLGYFQKMVNKKVWIDAWQWLATLQPLISRKFVEKNYNLYILIAIHRNHWNNHPNHLLADFLSRRLRFADKDETVGSEAFTSGGYALRPRWLEIHRSGYRPLVKWGKKHR